MGGRFFINNRTNEQSWGNIKNINIKILNLIKFATSEQILMKNLPGENYFPPDCQSVHFEAIHLGW